MYKEKTQKRVNELIEQANKVLATERRPGPGVLAEAWVDDIKFAQLRTSSLHFLKSVFGENSAYFVEFENNCKKPKISQAKQGFGILNAAKDEIENGFLNQIETIVSADIFSDFLTMSEYLLKENYYQAAASLAGAVLEDSLRKVCAAHNVGFKEREGLAALNEKLHGKNIYNKIVWKSVDTWREIRNSADHGKFNDFNSEMVATMIDGIRGFLNKHLN